LFNDVKYVYIYVMEYISSRLHKHFWNWWWFEFSNVYGWMVRVLLYVDVHTI